MPENEIRNLMDQIERKRHMGLFDDYQGFDVQEERRNGEVIHLIKQICKKLEKGKNIETIAEELESDVAYISKFVDIAAKYAPDYDAEKIYDEYSDSKKLVET